MEVKLVGQVYTLSHQAHRNEEFHPEALIVVHLHQEEAWAHLQQVVAQEKMDGTIHETFQVQAAGKGRQEVLFILALRDRNPIT